MCSPTLKDALHTSMDNPWKAVGKAIGGTARDVLNVGQSGDNRLGDKVMGGAAKVLAMGEQSGIPLLDTTAKYSNQILTGQDAGDLPMMIGDENFINLNDLEEDSPTLAALRARYREDRRGRYRGSGGTILTGPQGSTGSSNVPILSGRGLRRRRY